MLAPEFLKGRQSGTWKAGADAGASSGAVQRSVNVGILNVELKGFGNEMVVPSFISTALKTLAR